MDKRVVLSAGALTVALLGIGTYSAMASRSHKAADLASLRLQQSFMPRPGGPGRGPGGGMGRMTSELGLTADQQTKIKAIQEEAHAGHGAGQRPDREAMRAMRSKIDSVLTDAQRQKMASMRPPRGGDGGPGGPRGPGGQGGPDGPPPDGAFGGPPPPPTGGPSGV